MIHIEKSKMMTFIIKQTCHKSIYFVNAILSYLMQLSSSEDFRNNKITNPDPK